MRRSDRVEVLGESAGVHESASPQMDARPHSQRRIVSGADAGTHPLLSTRHWGHGCTEALFNNTACCVGTSLESQVLLNMQRQPEPAASTMEHERWPMDEIQWSDTLARVSTIMPNRSLPHEPRC